MASFLTPADPVKWRELFSPIHGSWHASPKIYNLAIQLLGCMNWAVAISSFYYPLRVSPNPLTNRLFTISLAFFSQMINVLILNSYYLSALKRHTQEQLRAGYRSTEILRNEILSPSELNEIFRQEIQSLTFQAFFNKYGSKGLTRLNSANRQDLMIQFTQELKPFFGKIPYDPKKLPGIIPRIYFSSQFGDVYMIYEVWLKAQLLDKLEHEPTFGYKNIPPRCRDEKFLKAKEFLPFLQKDANEGTYEAFVQKHGSEVFYVLDKQHLDRLRLKCTTELQAFYEGQNISADFSTPFYLIIVGQAQKIYHSVRKAQLIDRLKNNRQFGYKDIPAHLVLDSDGKRVIGEDLENSTYSDFVQRHGTLPPFVYGDLLFKKFATEYEAYLETKLSSAQSIRQIDFPVFLEHESAARKIIARKILSILENKGLKFLPPDDPVSIQQSEVLHKELTTKTYLEFIEKHGLRVFSVPSIFDALCRVYEKEFRAYLESQPLSCPLGGYENAPDEALKASIYQSVRRKQILERFESDRDFRYRDIPSDCLAILTEEEMNHWIASDLENQTHPEFIEKHGPDIFSRLNPVNLRTAKQKFIAYVEKQKLPLNTDSSKKMLEKLRMTEADVKRHLHANETALSLPKKSETEQRSFLEKELHVLDSITDPAAKEALLKVFLKIFLTDIEKDLTQLSAPPYVRLVKFFASLPVLHREIAQRIRNPQAASLSYEALRSLYTSEILERWARSDAECQNALREIYLRMPPLELFFPEEVPDHAFLRVTCASLKEILKKSTVSMLDILNSRGKELFLKVTCDNPSEWTTQILHAIEGRSPLALARQHPELFSPSFLTAESCLPGKPTLLQRVEEEASYLLSWEAFAAANPPVLLNSGFYNNPPSVIGFLALDWLARNFHTIQDFQSLPVLRYISETSLSPFNFFKLGSNVEEEKEKVKQEYKEQFAHVCEVMGSSPASELEAQLTQIQQTRDKKLQHITRLDEMRWNGPLATSWLQTCAVYLLIDMKFEYTAILLRDRPHLWRQFFAHLQKKQQKLDPALLQQAIDWLEKLSLENPSPLTLDLAWSNNQEAKDLFDRPHTRFRFINEDDTTPHDINLFVLRCLTRKFPGYLQGVVDGPFTEGQGKIIHTQYPQEAFEGLMEYYKTGTLTDFLKTYATNHEALEDLWAVSYRTFLPGISTLLHPYLTYVAPDILACLEARLDKKTRKAKVQTFLNEHGNNQEKVAMLWRFANRFQIPHIKNELTPKLSNDSAAREGLQEFDETNNIANFISKHGKNIHSIRYLILLAYTLELDLLKNQLRDAFQDVKIEKK